MQFFSAICTHMCLNPASYSQILCLLCQWDCRVFSAFSIDKWPAMTNEWLPCQIAFRQSIWSLKVARSMALLFSTFLVLIQFASKCGETWILCGNQRILRYIVNSDTVKLFLHFWNAKASVEYLERGLHINTDGKNF